MNQIVKFLSFESKRTHVFPLTILIVVILGLFISCGGTSEARSETKQEFYLGTSIAITIYNSPSDEVFVKIFNRIKDIDAKMSAQRPESEINQVGDAAGKNPVRVSDDTFLVVKTALQVAANSRTAFDPAIGPIVNLWNITGDNPHVATDDELAKLLPLVDWRDVEIDETAKTVFLRKPGMRLDLGGIAKGYAADESARICAENGVTSALLDLGGNIFVVGSKPNGANWKIGVQDPFKTRGEFIGILEASQATAVTSGPYERFFVENGVRYHHIINPVDGKPAHSGIEQVTILTKEASMLADGYTKPLFILGVEQGREVLKTVPGLEAIFVDEERNVYVSPGMLGHFKLTNPDFKLVELK